MLDGLLQPFARLFKAGFSLRSVEEGLKLALVLSDAWPHPHAPVRPEPMTAIQEGQHESDKVMHESENTKELGAQRSENRRRRVARRNLLRRSCREDPRPPFPLLLFQIVLGCVKLFRAEFFLSSRVSVNPFILLDVPLLLPGKQTKPPHAVAVATRQPGREASVLRPNCCCCSLISMISSPWSQDKLQSLWSENISQG